MFIYWLIWTIFLVGTWHFLEYDEILCIPKEKEKFNTLCEEEDKHKKN